VSRAAARLAVDLGVVPLAGAELSKEAHHRDAILLSDESGRLPGACLEARRGAAGQVETAARAVFVPVLSMLELWGVA